MSSSNNTARANAVVPEGFAIGTVGPDKQQYIMPHYMIPGYEHGLLMEAIANEDEYQARPTEAQSPYTERDGQHLIIPDDAVSALPLSSFRQFTNIISR